MPSLAEADALLLSYDAAHRAAAASEGAVGLGGALTANEVRFTPVSFFFSRVSPRPPPPVDHRHFAPPFRTAMSHRHFAPPPNCSSSG